MNKIFLVFILCCLYSNTLFSQEISRITTEDYPPLNFVKNNKLTGPAVDIIKAIQKSLNNKVNIEVMPWKRALQTTIRQANTVIFSIAKSGKRAPLYKWIGPIAVKEYSFYSLDKASIKLKNIKDALKYEIGVQSGSIAEEFLVSTQFKKINSVMTPQQNLNKLHMQRINLWYTSNATLIQLLKKQKKSILQKNNDIKKVLTVRKEYLYLAMNVDTSPEVISLWENAYKELYQQGKIKQIYEKYQLSFLYPQNI